MAPAAPRWERRAASPSTSVAAGLFGLDTQAQRASSSRHGHSKASAPRGGRRSPDEQAGPSAHASKALQVVSSKLHSSRPLFQMSPAKSRAYSALEHGGLSPHRAPHSRHAAGEPQRMQRFYQTRPDNHDNPSKLLQCCTSSFDTPEQCAEISPRPFGRICAAQIRRPAYVRPALAGVLKGSARQSGGEKMFLGLKPGLGSRVSLAITRQ